MAAEYVPVRWPKWFYGPEGQAQIFTDPLTVPEGWHDHPRKVGDPKAKTVIPGYAEALKAAETVAPIGGEQDENEEDEGNGVDDEQGVVDDEEDEQEDAIPEYEEVTREEISQILKRRGVEHSPAWPKQRLYDTLKDLA